MTYVTRVLKFHDLGSWRRWNRPSWIDLITERKHMLKKRNRCVFFHQLRPGFNLFALKYTRASDLLFSQSSERKQSGLGNLNAYLFFVLHVKRSPFASRLSKCQMPECPWKHRERFQNSSDQFLLSTDTLFHTIDHLEPQSDAARWWNEWIPIAAFLEVENR